MTETLFPCPGEAKCPHSECRAAGCLVERQEREKRQHKREVARQHVEREAAEDVRFYGR